MKTGYDQFFKKAKQTAAVQSRAENIKSLKKSKKPKRPFPIVPFFSFAIIGFGLLLAFEHSDTIEEQLKKIDISMSSALAEEKAHEAPAPAAAPSAHETAPVDSKVAEAAKEKKAVDDADYLFKLAERKKVLDQREEDLNKLAAELEKQKIEIEEKIKKIEETRTKISSVLEEKIKTDDAKVDSLVQMYTNMKPQQVAKVFETLDEDLVIEVLSRMKKKNAAEILNFIKPEKAQIFAERFTGYRTPANQ